MNEFVEYDLTENALDYLILAGEQAKEESPRLLKHAMANLADGVELLLKARLEMHDWKQVFAKPGGADRTKYEEGDFKSVSYEEATERLKDLCSVEINPASRAVIETLRKLRNRIRHFGVMTDRSTALSLLVKSFSFAIDFASENIERTHTAFPEGEMSKLRTLLGEFEDFVRERLAQLEPDLSRPEPFVDCPKCLQTAFSPDGRDEGARCLFCGFSCNGEDAARIWVDHLGLSQSPKDHMNAPFIENCPECGAEAFVNRDRILDTMDLGYLCFSCGEWDHYFRCNSCGRPCKGHEVICQDCSGQ